MRSALALFLIVFHLALSSNEPGLSEFYSFAKRYNKQYPPVEWKSRFVQFKKNVELINNLNTKATTASYAPNEFSDLSSEEFCEPNLKSFPRNQRPLISTLPPPNKSANPGQFDWTTHIPSVITSVKSQGGCGACWAYSAIENIEAQWALAGNPLVDLSASELIDCTHTSKACIGGWPSWSFSDLLQVPLLGQVNSNSAYPYSMVARDCTFRNDSAGAKITSFKSFSTVDSTPLTDDELENLLVQTGPLSVCINGISLQHYDSGIDQPTNCTSDYITHCMLLVGYGENSGTQFWKLKNSMSTEWGENGYYRLVKGTNQTGGSCGIGTAVTSAFV